MHSQWNRIENPEVDSHIDGKIIFEAHRKDCE